MVIKVLLVEKEATTSDLLVPSLERKGYEVAVARNRVQALRRGKSFRPDILVVDVASFGPAGYKLLEAVKAGLGGVPNIVAVEKKLATDESQAAAFLTMPITSRKLIYRLKKLAEVLPAREVQVGDLVVDPVALTLLKGQTQITLRPKEAALLVYFMRNPGRVLSRKEILKEVWDTDYFEDTRTLTVHIHWLRSKIEDDPNHPRMLRTVRGLGYRFDLPGQGG